MLPTGTRLKIKKIDNWTFTTPSVDMAIPIDTIVKLIPEYDEADKLESYLCKVDGSWKLVEENKDPDKISYLLNVQMKFQEKAADATKDIDIINCVNVRNALKERINPQKNIEKSELKLVTVERNDSENVEQIADQ